MEPYESTTPGESHTSTTPRESHTSTTPGESYESTEFNTNDNKIILYYTRFDKFLMCCTGCLSIGFRPCPPLPLRKKHINSANYACTNEDFPSARSASRENHE